MESKEDRRHFTVYLLPGIRRDPSLDGNVDYRHRTLGRKGRTSGRRSGAGGVMRRKCRRVELETTFTLLHFLLITLGCRVTREIGTGVDSTTNCVGSGHQFPTLRSRTRGPNQNRDDTKDLHTGTVSDT